MGSYSISWSAVKQAVFIAFRGEIKFQEVALGVMRVNSNNREMVFGVGDVFFNACN